MGAFILKKLSFNSYATEWINNINKNKYVCIFGAGNLGKEWCRLIEEYNLPLKIDFIVDNDSEKWGEKVYGKYECKSPEELDKYDKGISIVIATRYFKDILKQLTEKGFRNIFIPNENRMYFLSNFIYCNNFDKYIEAKENFIKLLEICEDEESKEVCSKVFENWFSEKFINIKNAGNQYFLDEIFKLTNQEVFVDCGAYTGDTIKSFLDKVSSFSKIYAFELEKNIYKKLEIYISKLEEKNKIKLYNIGVYDSKKTIKYNTNDTSSAIDIIGENEGLIDTLDNIINDNVTFIKMDIEGAELNALIGAKNIIKRQKPKLAICTYHKPEHLWEIPFLIKKILPEYKIYMRHHSDNYTETVCYAKI